MKILSLQKRFYAKKPKKAYVPPSLRVYNDFVPGGLSLFEEGTEFPLKIEKKLSHNDLKYEFQQVEGKLTETLFKTYERMEEETPLDVTKWKYGPQNSRKLGELERIQRKTSQFLKPSHMEESPVYQDAKIIEPELDYYENDFIATRHFYLSTVKREFCDTDNVARYRALLYSLVKNVEQIREIKEKILPKNGEIEFDDKKDVEKEQDILNYAKELAERFKGTFEIPQVEKKEEKKVNEDQELYNKIMNEAFNDIVMKNKFDGFQLNQYAMTKILGTDYEKNEKTIKEWILNLVKLFEKYQVNICHEFVLNKAKNLFTPQELTEEETKKFDKLIQENDELLYKMKNPFIIKKPVYGLETRRFQDEPYESLGTRFSKNMDKPRNR